MKNKFNQKFGPKNNPELDRHVFQTIAQERKIKDHRWFMWPLAATLSLFLTVYTLNDNNQVDPVREAYIQSVLEIQQSLDENASLEMSSDTYDLTAIAPDEI